MLAVGCSAMPKGTESMWRVVLWWRMVVVMAGPEPGRYLLAVPTWSRRPGQYTTGSFHS